MKTTNWRVSFSGPIAATRINRWRDVPGKANDPEHALMLALTGLRAGALRRYTAKHTYLWAYVSAPGLRCHANGRPMIVTSLKLELTPNVVTNQAA